MSEIWSQIVEELIKQIPKNIYWIIFIIIIIISLMKYVFNNAGIIERLELYDLIAIRSEKNKKIEKGISIFSIVSVVSCILCLFAGTVLFVGLNNYKIFIDINNLTVLILSCIVCYWILSIILTTIVYLLFIKGNGEKRIIRVVFDVFLLETIVISSGYLILLSYSFIKIMTDILLIILAIYMIYIICILNIKKRIPKYVIVNFDDGKVFQCKYDDFKIQFGLVHIKKRSRRNRLVKMHVCQLERIKSWEYKY